MALEEDKNLFNGVSGGVNANGIAGDANVDDTNVASLSALALTDLTACASGIGNPIIGAENAWYMSKVIFNSKVRDLVNAAGGNTIADLEGGQRPLLLGYPVNFVSALPSAPASGELVAVFGDLRLGAWTNWALSRRKEYRSRYLALRFSQKSRLPNEQVSI